MALTLAAGADATVWYDSPSVLKTVPLAVGASGTIDPHFMNKSEDESLLLVNLNASGDNAPTLLLDMAALASRLTDDAKIRQVVAKPSDGYGAEWKGGAVSAKRGLALTGGGKSSATCALRTDGEVWTRGTGLLPLATSSGDTADGLDFSADSSYIYSNVYTSGKRGSLARWTYDAATGRLVLDRTFQTSLTRIRNISVHTVGGKELVYCGEGAGASAAAKIIAVDVSGDTWKETAVSAGITGLTGDITNVKLSNEDSDAPVLYALCDSGKLAVCTLAADGLSVAETVKVFGLAQLQYLTGGTTTAKFRNFEVTKDGRTAFLINRIDAHNANLCVITSAGYIQATAGSAVNTGYHASGKTKIAVDFQMTTIKGGQDCLIGHYSGANFTVLIYAPGTDKTFFAEIKDKGHAGTSALPGTSGDTKRHTIVIDAPKRHVDMFAADGTRESQLDFPSDWTLNNTATFPLLLFSSSKDVTGTLLQSVNAKIYDVKIWETTDGVETLVHHYVPALNGGRAGFYDTVDGTFLSQFPAASAAFASGGDLVEVADDNTVGDPYLENDGSAYSAIDTRYVPNKRTKIEFDFQEMELAKDKDVSFGHYEKDEYSFLIYRNLNDSLVGTWKLVAKDGEYNGLELSPAVTADTCRHVAVFDIPNRRVELRDASGAVLGAASLSSKAWTWTFDNTKSPLTIFGSSTDAYGNAKQIVPRCRVYGLRLYENAADDGSGAWTTRHDYRPCLRDGVPGLRDAVTGRYISAGNLVAGGAIPDAGDTDPYLDTTTTGAAISIDTGYYVTSNTCIVCDFMPLKQSTAQQFLFEGGVNSGTSNGSFMRVYSNGSTGTGGISYACGQDTYVPIHPDYTSANGKQIWYAPNVRRKVTLDAYNRKVTLEMNGETVSEKTLAAKARVPDAASSTLKIFSNASGNKQYCMVRLYGFQIYEEGVLVRDYKPYVQRGIPGLRDDIGGGFITATANANLLTCGGGVAGDSTDAYLENDGVTALNLGYRANMSSRIEFDYAWTDISDGSRVVCGAWTTGTLRYCFWKYQGKIQYIFEGKSTSSHQTKPDISADLLRHTTIFDMKNKTLAYVTGGVTNKITRNASAAFNDTDASEDGFGVFSGIQNGIAQGMVSKARVYAVRIYENDEPKHEFLPYTDGVTNSLRDTITGFIAPKTSTAGDSDAVAWPTIGGMGADGAETWFVRPTGGRLSQYSKPLTLSAAAVGAVAYRWTKDGQTLAGTARGDLMVVWTRGAGTETYSVTPVYSVFGRETAGETISVTVEHLPSGLTLLLR